MTRRGILIVCLAVATVLVVVYALLRLVSGGPIFIPPWRFE
jgi:hypothetical protein